MNYLKTTCEKCLHEISIISCTFSKIYFDDEIFTTYPSEVIGYSLLVIDTDDWSRTLYLYETISSAGGNIEDLINKLVELRTSQTRDYQYVIALSSVETSYTTSELLNELKLWGYDGEVSEKFFYYAFSLIGNTDGTKSNKKSFYAMNKNITAGANIEAKINSDKFLSTCEPYRTYLQAYNNSAEKIGTAFFTGKSTGYYYPKISLTFPSEGLIAGRKYYVKIKYRTRGDGTNETSCSAPCFMCDYISTNAIVQKYYDPNSNENKGKIVEWTYEFSTDSNVPKDYNVAYIGFGILIGGHQANGYDNQTIDVYYVKFWDDEGNIYNEFGEEKMFLFVNNKYFLCLAKKGFLKVSSLKKELSEKEFKYIANSLSCFTYNSEFICEKFYYEIENMIY